MSANSEYDCKATILVQCPKCNAASRVYNMGWCALVCMGCGATMANPIHAEWHVGDECHYGDESGGAA